MVRLKARLTQGNTQHCGNLHSTMVRLKEAKFPLTSTVYQQFTFHYGSIKSEFDGYYEEQTNKFTFHYGSIKRIESLSSEWQFQQFTFHYGSIKSIMEILTLIKNCYLHSTMARLKGLLIAQD